MARRKGRRRGRQAGAGGVYPVHPVPKEGPLCCPWCGWLLDVLDDAWLCTRCGADGVFVWVPKHD